jgi:hypothetical protein
VYSQNCRKLDFLIVSHDDAYLVEYGYSAASPLIVETAKNDSLCVSFDMHFTDQIIYVNNWWIIENTSGKSNEWLLEKNAYPDGVNTSK